MMFTFSTLSVTCHSFCPSVHEVGEFPDVCYTSRITDLSFSKFLQETPKTCLYPTGDCLLVFTLFFVCWQNYAKKTTQPIFTKFGGKIAHGPRKNPLNVGGSTDRVKLLGLGLESMVRVDISRHTQQDCVTVR